MADDRRYEALEPLGGQTSLVRFTGSMQGKSIVWTVRLITLAHHYQSLPSAERQTGVRQFIAAEPVANGVGSATIALNLPCIDEPAVLKTMIMLRQWKRLGPGRHEYGETQRFAAVSSAGAER